MNADALFPCLSRPLSSQSDPIKRKPEPSKSRPICSCIVDVISTIALGIFYLASAWLSPFFFSVGFVAGAVYSEEVKKRISQVFKSISWTWLVPTAAVFYALSWPAAITIQSFIAGLDLGSRWYQAARK